MFNRKKKAGKTVTIIVLLLLIFTLYQTDLISRILYPYPYKQTVQKYAYAYGVDPLMVISVIREESHFLPHSNSHKGAVGLMQLMPDTAKDVSAWLKEDYELVDLTKPEDNIRYGTWYLANLNKQFSGNAILMLAAYNAGIGRVNSWLQTSPKDFNSYHIEDIPFKETRDYVAKVLNSYERYTELYQQ